MAGKSYIGTSGWSYGGWQGILYPEELRSKDYLPHYAGTFATVEVNYSFYHLPRSTTYEKWVALTPDDFRFALKLSRFITHIKRLQGVKVALRTFIKGSEALGNKRGPVLVQLPPSFSYNATNLKRLKGMLGAAQKLGTPAAVELRHKTWFVDEVYNALADANASLVIASSSRYPNPPDDVVTTEFVYFRFHGPRELFASPYTKAQLEHYARLMKRHLKDGRDVYAYFNNDVDGHAVRNARTLKQLIGG
jgi:uncharacterized protein YecE (DUF72 family)